MYKIIYPGFNLAWVFYLPSQVLLSYSINYFTKEGNKETVSNNSKTEELIEEITR